MNGILALGLPTPVLLLVVMPACLILAGLWLARRARGRNASLPMMIMVFSVVFSTLAGLVGLVVYDGARRDYRDCRYAVNRSFGSRDYNLHLIAVVNREIPGRPDIGTDLRAELDRDLPLRSLTECDSLKP